MSAAAPAPPPHHYPSQPGYSGSHDGAHEASSANVSSNGHARGFQRPLSHIKDIVANAEDQIDPYASIKTLVERVSQSSRQAKVLLQYGRPDLAYTEYLVATILLANVIPRHKDAPSISPQFFKQLTSKHHADQEEFDAVKELIKHDNAINRTERQDVSEQSIPSQSVNAGHSYAQPQSSQASGSRRPVSVQDQGNGTNGIQKDVQRYSIATPPSSNSTEVSRSSKPRPPVNPKPQSLHGGSVLPGRPSSSSALGQSTMTSDALTERFARLRSGNELPNQLYVNGQETQPSPYRIETSNSSFASRVGQGGIPPTSIAAPRGVSRQDTIEAPITRTPEISKDLPKPPSPTYSPIRTNAPSFQPGRASKSSADLSTNDRPPSSASSRGSTLQQTMSNGTTYTQYTETSSGQSTTTRRRRKTINLPQETEIDAERLFDYLKTYNVLLIDVRSREEYDEGHIFAATSICVEPTALRANMSADQLQEALVLSPEIEQDYLSQRDKFELVVYYNQSTSAGSLSRGNRDDETLALRYLHDALCEYNHDKPLSYPPVLLLGGLDAWVSLVGVHALITSNTAVTRNARATGAIKRRTAITGASRLKLPRKRHRDYNPLDPEEETKWRERARSESVVLDSKPQAEEENDEDGPAEPSPQFLRNYEEFYQRFPDVASLEQQSMISQPPTRLPPNPPQPPRHALPAVNAPLPSIPSRPPPALPRPTYSGVSERVATSATPTSNSAKLPAYIPPKLLRLPRTGLYNFGATCYMNATIQCLSATIPLTSFFLDGQWHKYLQKANWKGSKGIISEFYEILLRSLWMTKDVETIRPANFRKFCARLNKEWGTDRQQDAKEFLEFLVDCLHEDFNSNWAHAPLQTLTAEEEARRERMVPFVAAKIEWERYLHRDNSRITDLFAGQHISKLQCTTCRHSSTTYEPFYSISVEIPYTRHRSIDIHDCLRSYCSAEMLSGDEVWRCPHCRAEREATKRITISRAPEFLVIHFKRFSAGHSDKARKIMTPVDFPLADFDLEPYMLASPDERQREQISRAHGSRHVEAPWSMSPPYRYDAYAIIRHLGSTMTSGHYISLVRDLARGKWREFNDDRIKDFRPEDLSSSQRLQNEQAYIVFYQRVHQGPR